jgi:molecular chaperone GrpE
MQENNEHKHPPAARAPRADSAQPSQPPPAHRRVLKKELLDKVSSLEGQVARLSEEAEKARKECQQEKDRLLRAIAQERNLRSRAAAEEKVQLHAAKDQMLSSFLPLVDNFELALSAKEQSLDSLHEGVEIILRQLKGILTSHGVEEINPLHQPFDPNLHEAVGTASAADLPEGTVAAVQRKGFLLNRQLLRPAQVVVVAKPAEEGEQQTG